MKKEKEIVFVYETFLQSVAADIVTFIMAVSLIGVGVYLESTAMQWMAFVIFFTFMISVTTKKRMSREDAIEFLKNLKQENEK